MDRRASVFRCLWRDGLSLSGADVDAINDAAKPRWLALPPRAAAQEVVDAARAADAALDGASADLLQQIADSGYPITISRAVHRNEHLHEIEQVLQRR